MTEWNELDRRAFRNALGNFLTGVTVVTTVDPEGRNRGFTANSFTSVSLDPPLILICPAKNAASYEVFRNCTGFAVNVLGEDQRDVSNTFASKRPDKFDTVGHRTAATGAPIIEGCLSWFDCEPHEQVDAGDHMVLIGRVRAFDAGGGMPLAYLRGGYANLALESQAALAGVAPSAHVGCIVDRRRQVLLCRGKDGVWSIPAAPVQGPGQDHRQRIESLLAQLGVAAGITFLYSVFETKEGGDNYIVYRGEAIDTLDSEYLEGADTRFFGPEDLPWSDLKGPEFKTMLERYFRERSQARFGVYADAGSGGRVAASGGRNENEEWQ